MFVLLSNSYYQGKSLEKVLTLEPSEYERLLKENSSQITEEERNQPESYAYGRVRHINLYIFGLN